MWILGISILIVAPIIYLGLKKPTEPSEPPLTPQQQKIVTALEKDSDGDGLKDWEEALWKTDPHNKDTDGDGTPDGEEVAEGRDPLKAGPNDFLDTASTTPNGTVTDSNKPKTATEAFARDFFGKYIALVKKGGDTVSEEDQAGIISELLSKKYITLEPVVYPDTLIKTSQDNSKTALHSYGNTVGTIFIKDSPKVIENELTVFENAITIKNAGQNPANELAKLDDIVTGYQKVVRDLKLVTVPSDAKDLHVALLNGVGQVLSGIESLRASYDDPVRGLPTISFYQSAIENLKESMTQLYAYFVRNGVTFTQSESGYIFASVI
jgi:hypothetical protein